MKPDLLAPSQNRLHIIHRVAAAIFGGYIFATGWNIFLPMLFPGPKASALLEATLFSFVFYTIGIIWAFSVRSLSKAWLSLIIPGVLLGCIGLIWARGIT